MYGDIGTSPIYTLREVEDHVLVQDCESAILVGCDGSVDWLCWPRFDPDACFAALLGAREHGRWLALADAGARVTQRPRGDTLCLQTVLETEDDAVRLVDFMQPRDSHSNLVRLIIGQRGRVAMRRELVLRFGYGALIPRVRRLEGGALKTVAGASQVVLRTSVAHVQHCIEVARGSLQLVWQGLGRFIATRFGGGSNITLLFRET